MNYAEELQDERWKRKREEILERDNWTCVDCGEKKKSLQVHHKLYESGKRAWEADNEHLETLCWSCHEDRTGEVRTARRVFYRLCGDGVDGDLLGRLKCLLLTTQWPDEGVVFANSQELAAAIHLLNPHLRCGEIEIRVMSVAPFTAYSAEDLNNLIQQHAISS